MWLNSLDHRIHISSIFDPEVCTGYPLLLAVEAIQPGCVNWESAYIPPFKPKIFKIASVCNCNLVVDVCFTQWRLPLVNIGGIDIAEGKRMAILSMVWQLMRHHINMGGDSEGNPKAERACITSPFKIRSECAAAFEAPWRREKRSSACAPRWVIEEDVLHWANGKLASNTSLLIPDPSIEGGDAAAAITIKSLSDPKLGEGWILLQLLATISPRSVNSVYVLPGQTKQERESNARYIISIAQKLGCTMFLSWEDILECKGKMMLVLLASFMLLDNKKMVNQQHKLKNEREGVIVKGDARAEEEEAE
eukprot:gene13904-19831_t